MAESVECGRVRQNTADSMCKVLKSSLIIDSKIPKTTTNSSPL